MVARAKTTEEWVAQAGTLAPVVEEHRDTGEVERTLSRPVIDALVSAGFHRLLLPRSFGGEQAELTTAMRVVEELARQDGSVGWNVMVAMSSGLCADYLPEAGAREVFEEPTHLAAGSIAPVGRAVFEGGSYRLSGRWSFASGCRHAAWMACGGVVAGDAPGSGGEGPPEPLIFMVPGSEARIIDTWRTTGLRATGSHDIEVNDVFVPRERTIPFKQLVAGPPQRENRGYAQPFVGLAAHLMASVSLGIARDAIESFVALATTKKPSQGRSTLASQHSVHQLVGRAEGLLRSSRAYLYDSARTFVAEDEPQAPSALASARLAGAHVAQTANQVVAMLFEAGGGASIFATNRLDRCFRDCHVVNHHLTVAPSNIEMVGQYLLGLGLEARR